MMTVNTMKNLNEK